jgi:hypothetical protein
MAGGMRTSLWICVSITLAIAGCKKDKAADSAAGSAGSAAASGSAVASGSAAVAVDPGSGSAGSGSASGAAPVEPASGSAATRPAGITAELVDLTNKLTLAATGVVAELDATKGDCDKMATVLTAGIGKLKPHTDALYAHLSKLDEASNAWFAEHMVTDLGKAFESMDPVTATCKDHPGVQDAARNYVKALAGGE